MSHPFFCAFIEGCFGGFSCAEFAVVCGYPRCLNLAVLIWMKPNFSGLRVGHWSFFVGEFFLSWVDSRNVFSM